MTINLIPWRKAQLVLAAELFDLWDMPEEIGDYEKNMARGAVYQHAYGASSVVIQQELNAKGDRDDATGKGNRLAE